MKTRYPLNSPILPFVHMHTILPLPDFRIPFINFENLKESSDLSALMRVFIELCKYLRKFSEHHKFEEGEWETESIRDQSRHHTQREWNVSVTDMQGGILRIWKFGKAILISCLPPWQKFFVFLTLSMCM